MNRYSTIKIEIESEFCLDNMADVWLTFRPGKDGRNGKDGSDGYSPVVSVSKSGTVTTITITDATGTKTATINDGVKGDTGDTGDTGDPGATGKDGVSVTHSWNGTTLVVTSASGTSSADLKGDKGDKGDPGATGSDGRDGVGIESVSQTATSNADGGTNIITVTKTDGSTSTFVVKNGSRGSVGTDGRSVEFGMVSVQTLSAGSVAGADITENGEGPDGQKIYDIAFRIPAGPAGDDGQRGFGILKVTTAPTAYTTATGGFTPTYRIALSTVLTQSKATEVLVGDTLAYNYYQYPIGYVDTSYVYLGARTSVRGATGAAGTTPVKGTDYFTAADKAEMVTDVKDSLTTESWTFTLKDGTTVTKAVLLG